MENYEVDYDAYYFKRGYEFETETGEKRYIEEYDWDFERGLPYYYTYPVAVRSQIRHDRDLCHDYLFNQTHRICIDERELFKLKIKQLERQIAEGKISVETSLGTLEACIGGDKENYPEIFTYLRRPDGIEIDLVAVDVKKKENTARGYIYEDTTTDQYTHTYDWDANAINV